MRVKYELRARNGERLPTSHTIFFRQSLEYAKAVAFPGLTRYACNVTVGFSGMYEKLVDLEGFLGLFGVVPDFHLKTCEYAMSTYLFRFRYVDYTKSWQWLDEKDLCERIMKFLRD